MEIISLTNSSWLFKCTYWIPCIAYWNLETFSKGVIFLYPMKDGGMWGSKHISRKKIPIFFVVKVYLVRWYKENVNITICFMLIFRWLNTCFCLSPQKSIADSLVNIFFKKKCKSVVEICVPYLFYSHIRIKYYLFWLCSKILIVSFKSLIFNLCVPGSCFLWKYPKHNKSGFHRFKWFTVENIWSMWKSYNIYFITFWPCNLVFIVTFVHNDLTCINP